MIQRIEIPGTPAKWDRGTPLVIDGHARVVTSSKNRTAKGVVQVHALEAGIVAIEGPVRIRITAIWEWPKSSHRKTKPRPEVYYAGGPDADNVAKIILDALNGIAYSDDRQVAVLEVMKLRCRQGELARTTISIESLAAKMVRCG